MATAPNGDRRITLTISYPSLAKKLVQYGYCELNGLGTVRLKDGDELELCTAQSMKEDIQEARQIAEAEAAYAKQLEQERKARAEEATER